MQWVPLYMWKAVLYFLLSFATSRSCFGQLSDMLSVQKKNGKNIKTFVRGSAIKFYTTDGSYVDGDIEMIRDDSLFITSYDIRAIPNRWGVNSIDTLATYHAAYGFNEIGSVRISDRTKLSAISLDKLLMDAGAGYFILNLVNSDYLKEPFGSSKNIATLAISAGVFGTGLFLHTVKKDRRFSGRRHKIVYIPVR